MKEKIKEIKERLNEIEKEIKENEKLLKDPELSFLAKEEILKLEKEKEILEKELKKMKEKEERVICEIRAGVGGEEAALWAKDLYNMILNFSKRQNWKVNVFDFSVSDLGGFKEITFEIKGKGAFEKLKWEGGVHRVQRIPVTEKKGRIHTSTATVAILKEPEEIELKINPSDLKIEFMKSSGKGGQYVNKRMSAVRVTHLPTGISVKCESERSQIQNKENAIKILKAKLYEMERKKIEEEIEKERKIQIGFAKRSEKIRTYNFLQDRVTDHRIKKSWKGIDQIMEGKLDEIIKELEEFENKNISQSKEP
jgi:peptide chain release factor 1